MQDVTDTPFVFRNRMMEFQRDLMASLIECQHIPNWNIDCVILFAEATVTV